MAVGPHICRLMYLMIHGFFHCELLCGLVTEQMRKSFMGVAVVFNGLMLCNSVLS
jgi:hypothetical protein